MPHRLSWFKRLTLILAGLFLAYLLLAWVALPRILLMQAPKYIAEKTGHHLSFDRPDFNPFALRLRVANFCLDDPEGKPLLAFRELEVDLSAASLVRRAIVFDGIRLDAPQATVVLQADGRLNWARLLDALKSKEEKPDSPLPRIDIEHLVLSGGHLDFADHKSDFATRIEPLDVELSDISTLPDEKEPGRYKLTARTAIGARLLWQGEATFSPIGAKGNLGIEALELARLAPYLKRVLPSAAAAGVAELATDYRLAYADGHLELNLDNLMAKVAGAHLNTGPLAGKIGAEIAAEAVEAKGGAFDLARHSFSLPTLSLTNGDVALTGVAGAPLRLLQLGGLTLTDARVDLANRQLNLNRIAFKDGRLKAVRNAQGGIDVVDALRALATPGSAAKSGKSTKSTALTDPARGNTAAAPWKYAVDKLELSGFSLALLDKSVQPAADLALEDISFSADKLSDNLAIPVPIQASLRARSGGRLEASAQIIPAEAALEAKFKLADLALQPVQPYLNAVALLKLAGGKLDVDGTAKYGKQGADFKGGFALHDLRLTESDTGALFLAWKSLGSRDLHVTQKGLDVGTLAVDGLDTKLHIDKDKSVNVGRLLRKPAPAAAQAAVERKAAPTGKATPFVVNIDRLRVRNGEMDFADQSLALPFGTRVHHLRGAVNGLSSRPGAPGQVELDGQVDDYGLARAVGQIDLFDPTGFTDLKVVFRNVEMKRLTPYSATFAGRKIESGKLSLDLEYKIKQRQLSGDNKIVMDRLVLGERVEAPEAKNLPLDLAIAILQDADGRIDLGLPVSGSLDDPQFSYGGIIWKAILNVFSKIATAPFRMLGALFGGGEKFETIAFEAGSSRVTPPEREKLVQLATALNKRPTLSLNVHGVYAEADRLALQDLQLRRSVAERAGQHLDERTDPGPLTTHDPKVQAALESLYAQRIGSGELAALKAGFRQANPGQLEEGVAGKMMSRLTGLFREQRVLDAQEVAQLKGVDFHAVLFERLRGRETIDEGRLQALAKVRGEKVFAALKEAGAPMERLTLGEPEKLATAEGTGREVPVKLVLGVAKPAASPGNGSQGSSGK